MNFYVYVIGSKKKPEKTYVGWTNNLNKRILKHNLGVGAKFTRGRKWKLLYSETLKSKKLAMRREYQVKKNSKLRKFLREKI
tara:strand:+ start:350 stop:595 length:246 start_codon:yes stop_codon:yes gene_type:complete